MYGFLKEPSMCNKKDTVYKVMVHEIKDQGVAVYLYIYILCKQVSKRFLIQILF